MNQCTERHSKSRRRQLIALAIGTTLLVAGIASSSVSAAGAAQVSGTISGDNCTDRPSGVTGPPDMMYAFEVDGDLEGCVYGLVTDFRIHPSGTYQEIADEIFVGAYLGRAGTFGMTEFYTNKFVVPGDWEAGLYFARCKHPIVTDSGTGAFAGVSGRLDFKDDTEAGTAAYTGHLQF